MFCHFSILSRQLLIPLNLVDLGEFRMVYRLFLVVNRKELLVMVLKRVSVLNETVIEIFVWLGYWCNWRCVLVIQKISRFCLMKHNRLVKVGWPFLSLVLFLSISPFLHHHVLLHLGERIIFWLANSLVHFFIEPRL